MVILVHFVSKIYIRRFMAFSVHIPSITLHLCIHRHLTYMTCVQYIYIYIYRYIVYVSRYLFVYIFFYCSHEEKKNHGSRGSGMSDS